nr:MAG TPA: hypothetical protein [Caudoviricetes sp.]
MQRKGWRCMVCDTDMILEKCADDKIIGKMS